MLTGVIRLMLAAALLAAGGTAAFAAPVYRAERAGEVVRLEDTKTQTVVSIIPSSGNKAFEMKVKGQNVLYFPFASVEDFKAKGAGGFNGIPFLGPWANRLDEQAFYANGQRLRVRHGRSATFAAPFRSMGSWSTTDRWQVVDANADEERVGDEPARVLSRAALDEAVPFRAHNRHDLSPAAKGCSRCTTSIENLSTDPMPVAIGFHPYFQLTDSKRDDWTISVGAQPQWLLASNKVPTGETEPIERVLPGSARDRAEGLRPRPRVRRPGARRCRGAPS